MKRLVLLMFGVFFFMQGHAQFFKGFFGQKKEGRKLLAQQIVALNVYRGYLQKGFTIAQDGLRLVKDFKNGEFTLHKDYFNSLKHVNPYIRKYGKIAAIVQLQKKIIDRTGYYKRTLRQSRLLSPAERDYVDSVFARLLDDCWLLSDALVDVISSGNFEMTDAERLGRIDRLYGEAQHQYSFVEGFGSEALVLIKNREKELETVRDMEKYFGTDVEKGGDDEAVYPSVADPIGQYDNKN